MIFPQFQKQFYFQLPTVILKFTRNFFIIILYVFSLLFNHWIENQNEMKFHMIFRN